MRRKRLRVLFVAAEIFPMAKTGGLGDVAAALPVALRKAGVDVRLMMPAYLSALAAVPDAAQLRSLGDVYGSGDTLILTATTPHSGLPLYLVRNKPLFERDGSPYHDAMGHSWPDNAVRFAVLCAAASELALSGDAGWHPDVVHVNDWHTGLIPALIKARGGAHAHPASVLTIHNAAYQEALRPELLRLLGIAQALPRMRTARSFLGVGIATADYITAVSPTYAKEIQTPSFGGGLEKLIAARADSLRGILNGIDDALWDPQTDIHIAARYSARRLSGKALCKQALLAEMELKPNLRKPLVACVSRLTWQKGLDVLLGCLPPFLRDEFAFVLLGTGDMKLEAGFKALQRDYPGAAAVRIAYDEALAHSIVAGADIFVMPSRFEPCGLNQMYSQRYGTVPLVHAVGGLADTVRHAQGSAARGATGFVTTRLTSKKLASTLRSALRWRRDRSAAWRQLQRNGMRQDFSWAKPAQAYVQVYKDALDNAR